MWYEWESLEDFDAWHENVCSLLGYPLSPVNQSTGLIDEEAQKVVAYTSVIQVEDKFIAVVEEDYSEGLVETQLRPPVMDVFDL